MIEEPQEPTEAPEPASDPAGLVMSKEEYADWQDRIRQARDLRALASKWWEANLKRYAPSIADDAGKYEGDINTNRDFTLVERKKADLFYQQPDVTLVASPLFRGQEAQLDIHGDILNELLSRDGVDAKSVVHRVLFDVLCPSGVGFTKIGYEQFSKQVDAVDPETGEPTTADVPVFSKCYWKHFSPNQALIPKELTNTQWDDAPWLGWEFEIPLRVAKRNGWVADDFTGSAPDPSLRLSKTNRDATDSVVKCQEIFAKSGLFRDDVVHPQHITHIIFVEGKDDGPVVYRDSPDQTLDDRGQLTPDSLIGFPIHPLAIRTLTDQAYIPSDCTISAPIVKELNIFREQMLEFRDAAILRWAYDAGRLPTDALAKIVRSRHGGFIGLPSEAYAGEGAIKELPQGSYPRENFAVNDYLDNDLARTHALDQNQQGVESGGDQTATEAQIAQSNVNARLGFERSIVLDWYIRGVTKFSSCVQRYLDVEKAAQIVSPPAAEQWDTWRHGIPAALAFTALPDSALRTDTAQERKQALDLYSFFANDPSVNRIQLAKNVLRKFHLPATIVSDQPPQKGPEPTKPGFSFKGDDLNPLMPQFPIVMEILRQSGIQVSPQAVMEAQAGAQNQLLMQQLTAQVGQDTGQGEPGPAEHGGKQPQAETLSKHHADETGGMQGTGAPAAMGPGGMV